MNRSVQLVARNRECPKGLNKVPCVVWSCIKMHATHWKCSARRSTTQTMHNKKADFPRREISFWHHLFRIVACNLLHEIVNVRKGNNVPYVFSSCIKMHATHEIINYALRFNPSCNMLHATHEIMNYALRLIIRATSCKLRTKSWIAHWG